MVDEEGTPHAIWLAYTNRFAAVAYTAKRGSRFSKTRYLSKVDEIRSPVPWGNFFTNSFPALAVDGATLHIVWTNWNGKDADIVYVRSIDRGVTWSSPVTIDSNPDDQFLPRVSARNGIVAVGYLDHYKDSGSDFHAAMLYSNNGGDTWSRPIKISKKKSSPEEGNRFGYPLCDGRFMGDYNGITVDSRGRAHVFWTDIRKGNSPNDGGDTRDQDPYMATVSIPK